MDSKEEEIIRLLTDSTNRAVLSALGETGQEIAVTEIAESIVSRDTTTARPTACETEFEQVAISLKHDHLPRLDDADLIEYDRDGDVVTRGGYTAVDPEWASTDILEELFRRVETGTRTDETIARLLEGRNEIYEYGRELAETAENELFLIYASAELLDEACLPYAESAIERDVAFHAGAKSQDAREFFRETLPEATVWEPQLDWMYSRSDYPKISRLILADRASVMVGLWNADSGGSKREIAMIAEGKTNPFVVLVRELLGPRLDHLDYQSDEFLDGLPFET